jgi:hypothetical protein
MKKEPDLQTLRDCIDQAEWAILDRRRVNQPAFREMALHRMYDIIKLWKKEADRLEPTPTPEK